MSVAAKHEDGIDSGIDWIGVVPRDWRVLPSRRVCELTTGWRDTQDACPDGEYPFFVRSQTVERIDSYSFDGEGVLTSGDGAGVGKIFHHFSGKFEFHQRVYLFHAFRGITGRYFFYYLRELFFRVALAGNAKSTVDSLRRPMLRDFPIAFPPVEQQRLVTDFLDRKTAAIDALIEKKERLIALLEEKRQALITQAVTKGLDPSVPMKDSGIEWLGEIPAHWEVKRGRYLFAERRDGVLDEDDVVTSFRDGQVTLRTNRRTDGYTLAVKEVGYQHVTVGDLVINSMDAFAGAVGVSESDGKCSPEYVVLRARDGGTQNQYFSATIRLMALRGFVYVICPSVRERAPRFRFATFKDVWLPVPPADEQQEIAHALMSIPQEFEPLRELAQRQVARLREYRQALITAAVTGQFDIPETDSEDAA